MSVGRKIPSFSLTRLSSPLSYHLSHKQWKLLPLVWTACENHTGCGNKHILRFALLPAQGQCGWISFPGDGATESPCASLWRKCSPSLARFAVSPGQLGSHLHDKLTTCIHWKRFRAHNAGCHQPALQKWHILWRDLSGTGVRAQFNSVTCWES